MLHMHTCKSIDLSMNVCMRFLFLGFIYFADSPFVYRFIDLSVSGNTCILSLLLSVPRVQMSDINVYIVYMQLEVSLNLTGVNL